jgi:hypothetical protein
MIQNSVEKEWQDILLEVSRRTAVDPEFRALALSDAAAAIAQVTTKPIPPSLAVRFVDNTGMTKTIPLPEPLFSIQELSDAELELVAAAGSGSISASWTRGGFTVSGSYSR